MPLNAYAEFVKNHMHEFSHLPPKDRMRECAKLYHKMKGSQPKKAQPKGAGFHLPDLGFGLAMKKPAAKKPAIKKPAAKPKGKKDVHGGAWYDDFVTGFKLPFQAAASLI